MRILHDRTLCSLSLLAALVPPAVGAQASAQAAAAARPQTPSAVRPQAPATVRPQPPAAVHGQAPAAVRPQPPAAVHARPSAAIDPLPPLDEYHVRVFTVEDGLLASDVTGIVQGANGYLYLAGGRGLLRFDGHGFEQVPIEGFSTHFLYGLHRDRSGRVWARSRRDDIGYVEAGRAQGLPEPPAAILGLPWTSLPAIWLGSEGGLLHFDPETATYTAFTTDHGLPNDTVVALVEMPDGEQVVVTRSGLALLKPDDPSAHAPRFESTGRSFRLVSPRPHGAFYRGHGALWLNAEEGILRYRDGRIEAYRTGSHEGPSDQIVALEDIAGDRSGESIPRWLAYRLRRPGGPGVQFPSSRATVLPGADGTFWFTALDTATGGARLVRERDGRRDLVPLEGVPVFLAANTLIQDHEGGVWAATDRGLIHLAPRRVAGLTRRHGLAADFTTAILQTGDGAVWVGSWGGGLHRFAGGRLDRRYTTRDGLPDDRVRGLYETSDGTLWATTQGGVVALRPSPAEPDVAQIDQAWPTLSTARAVAETRRNEASRLWVAAGPRLLVGRLDARSVERIAFEEFRPDVDWGREIWALHTALDGALWVGGSGGLFRIEGDSVHAFGPEDGLRGQHVSSIYEEEDGTLWIGTYEHGLHRYRAGRFVAITTREGLHHNGVWAMLDDGRGYVWMSSDGGIFRVEWARLHAVADALERGLRPERPLDPLVFTEAEGSPSRESNRASPGGWRLMDGRLVFNNIAGVVVIDPERAARPPPPPRIRLQSVFADGREVPLEPGTHPELPAGVRHVDFAFSALAFTTPEQNRYRYRLDGYDGDWIDADRQRRVSYTGLTPGRYTFRVQAATGTGPWSEREARYAFVVPPFFWQTLWFRGMLMLAGAGLLAAWHRYRVRRVLAMERLRLRIASDLHDDVGSNLSSIALLSEMLRDRARVEGLERRQLERISLAAGETIGSLREIIWLVDPKHDNLADLVQRMRNTATNLLNGTTATFAPREPLDRRPLDPAFVRQVFLIYKEALHNVAKHADARHVRIEVGAEQGMFVMRIEDDGSGFRTEGVAAGHGLESMRRRAEEVGGELAIESAPGGGTRITFRGRMG